MELKGHKQHLTLKLMCAWLCVLLHAAAQRLCIEADIHWLEALSTLALDPMLCSAGYTLWS